MRAVVYSTIRNVIADYPGLKRHDPALGLVVYSIDETPFFILYEYDDVQRRVHFVFISGKPLSQIDPTVVEW